MVDPSPTRGVAVDHETFFLCNGYVLANEGVVRGGAQKPYASIALSHTNLSLSRPEPPTSISWPLSSVVSTAMARKEIGGEGDPSRWRYTMKIEFLSGESLVVGIEQGIGESEDMSDPDPGEYRRLVLSLHRLIAIHAPQAAMTYRGGPLLQSVWALLLVLGLAVLAVDRLGSRLATNLIVNGPMDSIRGLLALVLIVGAYLMPAGIIFWLWWRILRRKRRYHRTSIPPFLLPEPRAS